MRSHTDPSAFSHCVRETLIRAGKKLPGKKENSSVKSPHQMYETSSVAEQTRFLFGI